MKPSITSLLKRTNLTETEKSKLVAELIKHFQQRKASMERMKRHDSKRKKNVSTL